jgi:hypothetical protein
MKKLIIVLALAALVVGGVFAQRVGDTVQVSGQNYRVTEVSGDRLVLQKSAGGYQVGDTGPGGGIIFYVNPAGFRVEAGPGFAAYTANYLEAAPDDLSVPGTAIIWGQLNPDVTTFDSATHANAKAIGNGRKDTAIIVEAATRAAGVGRGVAAVAAAALTTGGKNDWFIPSAGELALLYAQRNLPGLNTSSLSRQYGYWTSSQGSTSGTPTAWRQRFDNGQLSAYGKASSAPARAIRAF